MRVVSAQLRRCSRPSHAVRVAWRGAGTDAEDAARLAALVREFRTNGHLCARLDPLGRALGPLTEGNDCALRRATPVGAVELARLLHGFPDGLALRGRPVSAERYLGLRDAAPGSAFRLGEGVVGGRAEWTVRDLVAHLAASYCGTLAAETVHLGSRQQRLWLWSRLEAPVSERVPAPETRREVLRLLLRADGVERLLARHFPSSKRFGLEGGEALVPGLHALLHHAAAAGVARCEVGMAHRGRLNVLVNVLRKPLGAVCVEMNGEQSAFHVGDVKYHLPASGTFRSGERSVQVALAPNPSHLEAVDPVVVGTARALQVDADDTEGASVLPVVLHGDAAFAGLGLVMETMQLHSLDGYSAGGTVHVVLNNQIGFTTDPKRARSTAHPTDVAKGVGAPVLHVNVDDPDAVVRAFQLAGGFRRRFRRDVVVDLVCYRRHGHNELDDPRLTQPLTYAKIERTPPCAELYAARLVADGVASEAEVRAWRDEIDAEFQAEFEGRHAFVEEPIDLITGENSWQREAVEAAAARRGVVATRAGTEAAGGTTGVPLEHLQRLGAKMTTDALDDFELHPHALSVLGKRRAMLEGPGARVDWAFAEALAFASLLHEPDGSSSASVRLSGQDCERGTFNQRHAVLYCQRTSRAYTPLQRVALDGRFDVLNSPLSEAAVLGFEYGYSLGSPKTLVLWEAQFGDFANNAQVFIDQFIACGEERWGLQSNIVLLLPHGYDGQGPDHSNARIERFLSLCNDDSDKLPGASAKRRQQVLLAFDAVDEGGTGRVSRSDVLEVLRRIQGVGDDPRLGERLQNLWQEMDVTSGEYLSRAEWERFMLQYSRRNAEAEANMFLVNVSTPAQFFHVLRRQVHRRYAKPLVVFAPKYLLHHRPCSSALEDFGPSTFFTRVIDDGKFSDNTRHRARHPKTGAPLLLPPERIRRVVLCSGQVYYHLSQARRARRTDDIVLVRLEQLAPFPHDRMMAVISRYPSAELVWCQEEPKNAGAWLHVQAHLGTAMRELGDAYGRYAPRPIRFVGRAPSASAATASQAIHRAETAELVDEALR